MLNEYIGSRAWDTMTGGAIKRRMRCEMKYGVSYAASFDAVKQAKLAEKLGFDSIGFFDSPALEPDVWITIANAIQATSSIQVGTKVLIPHLRHPVAQASAIATIEHLAPGRLFVGIGTGFTGRMAMGQRPLTWQYLAQFLTQIRGLLAGDQVEIDGTVSQLLHPPGFAPPRPIKVPFLVAANGPKGIAVARELGDGLIYAGDISSIPAGFDWLNVNAGSIILREGDTVWSQQVVETARILFGLRYHLLYDGFHHDPVREGLPYLDDWLKGLEILPREIRHLAVHDRHTVGTNELDAAFISGHPDAFAAFLEAAVQTPAAFRQRVTALEAAGVTHVDGPARAGRHWEWATRAYAEALGL